jgi:hypothetical protein
MIRKLVDDVRGGTPAHYENKNIGEWRDQVLLFDEKHPSGTLISFEQLFEIMITNPGLEHKCLRSGMIVWMIDRPDHSRYNHMRLRGQVLNFNLSSHWFIDQCGYEIFEQSTSLMVN